MSRRFLGVLPSMRMRNDAIEYVAKKGTMGESLAKFLQEEDFLSFANIPYDFDYSDIPSIETDICCEATDVFPDEYFPPSVTSLYGFNWELAMVLLVGAIGDWLYILTHEHFEGDTHQYLDEVNTYSAKGGGTYVQKEPYIVLDGTGDPLSFIVETTAQYSTTVIRSPNDIFTPKGVVVHILDDQGKIAFLSKRHLFGAG